MSRPPLRIQLPADAALAVTIRAFASECARRLELSEDDVEDLRLIATELLANAVETGQPEVAVEIAAIDGAWTLSASGVGSLETSEAPSVGLRRLDVLQALAEVAEQDGTTVISSAPRDPAYDPS